MKARPVIERFLEKFTIDWNGCWEWEGLKKTKGRYGQLFNNGNTVRGHRLSYELFYGPINGFHVCHHCDNPGCVRPSHLFLGTQKDNMQDAGRKQRMNLQINPDKIPVGEQTNSSKLTEREVLEIRKKYSEGFGTHQDLADEYDMSRIMIGYIIRKTSWKHI